jgi:hypothetical protein
VWLVVPLLGKGRAISDYIMTVTGQWSIKSNGGMDFLCGLCRGQLAAAVSEELEVS